MSVLAITALLLSGGQIPRPVEVPFRIGEDALIVDAVVNGHKASFLFDTGFGGSVVVSDSIDMGPPTGHMTLRDFVGEFDAKTIKVTSMKLGPMDIKADGMQMIQQTLRGMSIGYNMHTDGIMGLEVIKNYVTEFNFEKQKLVFYPSSVDISKRVPDNKKTFLSKLLPIGNNSLEMQVKTAGGRSMVMGLDTGNSFFATTHKDVLQRVNLWPNDKAPQFMKMSGVASGPVDSWDLQVPHVEIFGIPVENSVWSVIDLPASAAETDGTVGFQFLKNFNITIDFNRRRVWFENFTGKTGNVPVAETGISGGYRPSTKKVEVWRVTPGSPAALAGIKQGDEILSIDDQALVNTNFRKLSTMMEGALGSKVHLAISRGGELKRFDLERAYLVNVAS